jgi:hypothetical protein
MADEYIRRDFALAGTELYKYGEMEIEAVSAEYIQRLPAADVVEVVRCRDCEYLRPTINVHTGKQSGIWCALHDILNVSPDDYCSRGEKKGGRPCD